MSAAPATPKPTSQPAHKGKEEKRPEAKPNQGPTEEQGTGAATKKASIKDSFDWAALPPAVDDKPVFEPRYSKVDVERDIPKVVRDLIELSLKQGDPNKVIKARAEDGKPVEKKVFEAKYKIQPVRSKEEGMAFLNLARKYGKFRPTTIEPYPGQITVRGTVRGPLSEDTREKLGVTTEYVVRVSGKPAERRETRTLPGGTA